MSELKAWTQRQETGEEPRPYSIHFEHVPPDALVGRLRGWTQIVNMRMASVHQVMSVSDNIVVRFCEHLLSAGGKNVEPDTMHLGSSTKLKWESFLSHQMGCGMVAFRQSYAEKADGQYDPHPALIHENAENTDPDVMRVVENECAILAHLLNKFRFDNDFISEQAKSCATPPEVLHLPEVKWKELPEGTYKIRGTFKTGPVRYVLQYEKGDRKDVLFLHHVESTAMIDDSLLDTEVVATVLKLTSWSGSLLAVEPYNR